MSRLQPQQRLLTAAQYREVFQHTALRSGQKELLILGRPNQLTHHRLGLAIAKKHVPLAVKRNLIKRIAREQFRLLPPAQTALDIVILSRPAAKTANRQRLNAALRQIFLRLGLETTDG
jgi:ribonuclease P protein component